ncbi:Ig-like domain repeat protein [Nocardioides alcanivorans]|uniref:Ig-like domain repeat protein n=1 Tax=Nocardioides alcanivorans TaxID=2897352 RepID=UPI001F441A69|nr:Ig-like domain repeat protein [Nocardioides alcanivorans]
MSSRLLTRGVATVGSLAVAVGLLTAGGAQATTTPSDAGQALAWGVPDTSDPTLSAALLNTPLAKVESGFKHAVFLSASGKVFTSTDKPEYEPPSSLINQTVVDVSVSMSGSVYVALNDAGEMTFWGAPATGADPSAVDVSNLVQVSMGGGHAVGIKEDGTVVAWGNNTYGQTDVPEGLSNVTKVVTGTQHTYALRANGSVVAWGDDTNKQVSHLPTELTLPGAVKDIEARSDGGLALLADGTLASWGKSATVGRGTMYNQVPASLDGKIITQISAGADTNLAIDSDGAITTWGNSFGTPSNVPDGLDGRGVASVSVGQDYAFAIQRKVMTISESTVAGTAKEGQTLTGTPASFSGGPEITYEWLANGTQIAGADSTTLTLSKAEVGKKIAFRTVATKDGEVLTSDSTATAAVVALAPAVSTTKTQIGKPKVKNTKKGKKNGKANFTVKVTGNKPAGKVKVVVKLGKKKAFNKAVNLNKKGVAKVKLKKLKKGQYKIAAKYAGNKANKKSTAKSKFRVK